MNTLNVNNESSPLKDSSSVESIQARTLTPEELKAYKNCTLNSYFKAGIPFATLVQIVKYIKNPAGSELIPKSLNRNVFSFFGNVIIGALLYSPVCYYKLAALHEEIEKRTEMSKQNAVAGEGKKITSGFRLEDFSPGDFSYPSDTVSNLNDPETNFSSDFNLYTSLIEEKEEIKAPSTTYQDLRTKHRNNLPKRQSPLPPDIEQGEPKNLSAPFETTTITEPKPQRLVKRNKYGDEME